jgi:hypothetical protein
VDGQLSAKRFCFAIRVWRWSADSLVRVVKVLSTLMPWVAGLTRELAPFQRFMKNHAARVCLEELTRFFCELIRPLEDSHDK